MTVGAHRLQVVFAIVVVATVLGDRDDVIDLVGFEGAARASDLAFEAITSQHAPAQLRPLATVGASARGAWSRYPT